MEVVIVAISQDHKGGYEVNDSCPKQSAAA